MKDYYSILGIDPDASEDDIKRAYRKKSKECHPDLFPDDKEKEEQFREITEAYENLLNKPKDNLIPLPGDPQIFLSYTCTIKELFQKTEKELSFQVGKDVCPYCKGSGRVRKQEQSPFGIFIQDWTCPHCKGSGRIGELETKTFKITPEYYGTHTIYIDGFKVILICYPDTNDKFFTPNGIDIETTLDIDPVTAVLGGKVKLEGPDGDLLITIPKGTQNAKLFTLKGKGLNSYGDLYIHVNIKIPTELSDKERELYKQLQECQKSEI